MNDSDQVFEGKTGGMWIDQIGLSELRMKLTVQRVKDVQELGALLIDAVLLSLDGEGKVSQEDPDKNGISCFVKKLEAITKKGAFTRHLVEEVCRESLPFWEPLFDLETTLELIGRHEGVRTSFTVVNPGPFAAYEVEVQFPGYVADLEGYEVPEEWTETVCEGCEDTIIWDATFHGAWEISEGLAWWFSKWFEQIPRQTEAPTN